MKITEDVTQKYAAEQGVSEDEAIKRGLEEKAEEFVKKVRKFMRNRNNT
jgi:phosphomethylpyrimidine synthase